MCPGRDPRAAAGRPARPVPRPAAAARSCRSLVGGSRGALGVYGKLHEPTGIAVNLAGFSGPHTVKVWLATVAFVLALVQLVSALAMYGKLPASRRRPGSAALHRWSGRLAFLSRCRWPSTASTPWASDFDTAGAHPLAARLLLLRRVHGEDADPDPQGRARLGAAALRRPGLHRAGRPVADLVAVVLHHHRRARF